MNQHDYTAATHDEAAGSDTWYITNIEREIDALHTTCARLQREACLLYEGADKLVPIEHARKPTEGRRP